MMGLIWETESERRARSEAMRLEEIKQLYRNVFGSAEGRRVLGHILVENHFGVPLNNDVERIEYNVGVAIARLSGLMEEVDQILNVIG
jgi:hypothetical protein